jgi:deoxyadenosine/deoxycytidine kinase
MAKMIIVVGNSGVGKTTLTHILCQQGGYAEGLEQLGERPFQKLFSTQLQRYSLANQFDFLLFRAEQELAIRNGNIDGILDGGLEEDFYIFTRHFYDKGYLEEKEYRLCEKLVEVLRQLLPAPDLIVALEAPLDTIAQRYSRRNRPLEIARRGDLSELQTLLDDWLACQMPSRIIRVDATPDDPSYAGILPFLLEKIRQKLNSGKGVFHE